MLWLGALALLMSGCLHLASPAGSLPGGGDPSGSSPAVLARVVTAGVSHSLVLAENGTLYAWGWNNVGQLGFGSTDSCGGQHCQKVPSLTDTGATFIHIAAGRSHSLALAADGTLYAWGGNENGQLGDGTNVSRSKPTHITPNGVTFTDIAAGEYFSLALASDGTLYAWGANWYGQLGFSSTDYCSSNACQKVPSLTDTSVTFTDIAAGAYHSLALASDGKLYAWGLNVHGQLGFSSTDACVMSITSHCQKAPSLTDTGVTFTGIAAGNAHSLAFAADGTLYAWGLNAYGQLGFSSADICNAVSCQKAPSLTDVSVTFTDIAAGLHHSLALAADGTLYAWGWNRNGQLGLSSTEVCLAESCQKVPSLTDTSVTFTDIAAGDFHSLAIASDGRLFAWGYNNQGQLGDGTTTQRSTPTDISFP